MNTAKKHEAELAVANSSTFASAQAHAFGKFQLLAKLGSGGMGEVFLALSRGTLGVRKLVVIKRLKQFAEAEERSEAETMFMNEARLATRLNHPNIVQTNDVGVEGGDMFLTMEYLEGQSLNTVVKGLRLRQRKIEDGVWAKIISDVLCGLHYAHDLRDFDGTPLHIVHRDLSPHNLFVTYEGVVKVVDFGIAKTETGAKTENGVIKGKFAYMAPEHALGEKVDRRADVFVMGIVLWELLTGERCVYRRNDVTTIHRLLNEQIDPPSTVRPDIDPKLDTIVIKALSRDRGDRYQSAHEMRDALEDYLATRFRPVRQEELGSLVTGLFREERASMQQKVQQCIASAQENPVVDDLPALTSYTNLETVSRSGSGPHRSGSLGAVISTSPTALERGAPNKMRNLVAACVLAAVALSVGGWFVLGRNNQSPATSAASSPPSPREAPRDDLRTAATAASSPPPQEVTAATSVVQAPKEPRVDMAQNAPSAAATNAGTAPAPRGGAGSPRSAPPAPAVTQHPIPTTPQPTAKPTGRVFNTEL